MILYTTHTNRCLLGGENTAHYHRGRGGECGKKEEEHEIQSETNKNGVEEKKKIHRAVDLKKLK